MFSVTCMVVGPECCHLDLADVNALIQVAVVYFMQGLCFHWYLHGSWTWMLSIDLDDVHALIHVIADTLVMQVLRNYCYLHQRRKHFLSALIITCMQDLNVIIALIYRVRITLAM